MRAKIFVYLDRCRAQRTGDNVSCKCHGAQSRGGVLQVDEDDVDVGRREDADKGVAEHARGHDGRPYADVALQHKPELAIGSKTE